MDVRPVGNGTHEARVWVNNVTVISWTNVGSNLAFGTIGLKVREAHAHFDNIVVTDFCE